MGLHPKAETFSKQLVDEVRMFFRASDGLFSAPADSLEHRVFLDSFLVHYRLLFGFFRLNPRGDDCAAEHYMPDRNQWWDLKKDLYHRTLGDERAKTMGPREQVQQAIGHLTYEGIGANVEWPIADIIADTYEAWELFLDRLHPDQRQWFPENELPEITACKQTIFDVAG